jgi:hypothetical protein
LLCSDVLSTHSPLHRIQGYKTWNMADHLGYRNTLGNTLTTEHAEAQFCKVHNRMLLFIQSLTVANFTLYALLSMLYMDLFCSSWIAHTPFSNFMYATHSKINDLWFYFLPGNLNSSLKFSLTLLSGKPCLPSTCDCLESLAWAFSQQAVLSLFGGVLTAYRCSLLLVADLAH